MPFTSFWAASLLLTLASAAPYRSIPLPGEIKYGIRATFSAVSLNKNWYNNKTGLWGELWWNSANALTTIVDHNKLSPGFDPFTAIIENTFNEAQHIDVGTRKFMNRDNGGMVESNYCINGTGSCATKRDDSLAKRGFKNFLNKFYDDEGWWALALIRCYDVTHEDKYLDAAVTIFEDMKTGLGGPCHGGIYWSKDREYVNAIANELYLSVAASLANRVSSEEKYLQIAEDQWKWFYNSGMINSDNLINDGLNGDCKNNGQTTWTYNQGVILGGLVELSRATSNSSLLDEASKIAKAAIAKFSNKDGVLEENGGCEHQPGRCGVDGQQFKGVFIRNLGYLQQAAPDAQFRSFILTNVDSIWEHDLDKKALYKLGVAWAGPYYNATMPSQSSAIDALVAGMAVA